MNLDYLSSSLGTSVVFMASQCKMLSSYYICMHNPLRLKSAWLKKYCTLVASTLITMSPGNCAGAGRAQWGIVLWRAKGSALLRKALALHLLLQLLFARSYLWLIPFFLNGQTQECQPNLLRNVTKKNNNKTNKNYHKFSSLISTSERSSALLSFTTWEGRS